MHLKVELGLFNRDISETSDMCHFVPMDTVMGNCLSMMQSTLEGLQGHGVITVVWWVLRRIAMTALNWVGVSHHVSKQLWTSNLLVTVDSSSHNQTTDL